MKKKYIGAEDDEGFLQIALFGRDGKDSIEDEGGGHGAVFAAAVADEPGTLVIEVELAEGIFDGLEGGG
jgi:hypothetical protein